MVTKCANPSCDTRFRYFRGGKLFVFEPRERSSADLCPRVEHFWLCEDCAPGMTIVVDREGYFRVESVRYAHSAA